MRDIIWTVIGIWLIYKLVDAFRAITAKKSVVGEQNAQQRASSPPPKKDIHSALQKHLNKEGEYVDFEEIK
ncbi:MAG: hypothetical protein V4635_11835 [Bacteroidota bacterium]